MSDLDDDQKVYIWGKPSAPYLEGRTPKRIGPAESLVWVEDSPFGVPGVDVRPYCQGKISACSSKAAIQRFSDLREDYGRRLLTVDPPGPCFEEPLRYPALSARQEGIWFRAERLEDFWDIYAWSRKLLFAHSWSGALLLMAEFEQTQTELRIDRVCGALGPNGVDFLLKSHVLERWVPHTVPTSVSKAPATIGEWSFRQYGRRAYFGTYEDTRGVPALEY